MPKFLQNFLKQKCTMHACAKPAWWSVNMNAELNDLKRIVRQNKPNTQ